MAYVPGELEEVAHLLRERGGAGRVLGATWKSDTASDIELVMLRPTIGGFAVRHVIIDVDQLSRNRNEFLAAQIEPTFRHAEQYPPTLLKALEAVAALSAKAWSARVPGWEQWKGVGGPFEEQFKRSNLHPHIDHLPRRPRPQRILRATSAFVKEAAAVVVLLMLAVLGAGYEVSGYDDDASISDVLFFGLVAFGALALLIIVGMLLSMVWGRFRRKRPPPSAAPSGGRHAA